MSNVVPVLELGHDGVVKDTVFVPVHQLDSLVGELSDDYDFGLGQMQVTGARKYARELGKLSVAFQAPKLKVSLPKLAIAKPKVTASVKPGAYKPLKPPAKPVKKAPIKAAVRKVQKSGQHPAVIARPKSNKAATMPAQPTLSHVYDQLKKQGKIIDLMQTKRCATSEHNKLMADDAFQGSVMDMLAKIDKQISGTTNENYFARWNRLKNVTGVALQHK